MKIVSRRAPIRFLASGVRKEKVRWQAVRAKYGASEPPRRNAPFYIYGGDCDMVCSRKLWGRVRWRARVLVGALGGGGNSTGWRGSFTALAAQQKRANRHRQRKRQQRAIT